MLKCANVQIGNDVEEKQLYSKFLTNNWTSYLTPREYN